jgi:DNA-binding transcriptional MerR regulator
VQVLLDLALTATFTLTYTTEVWALRERLRIGEVAKLLGVTPKTLRHYEEVGLLQQPERTEAGYRLYSADDLLRLHRIKRLQSLGLSLKQVGAVLGDKDHERSLKSILETLLAEVEAEMRRLDERRERIKGLLAGEGAQAEASPSFEKAMELLGEHLDGVSETALEQEKRLWAVLDAFEWPEGYREGNEELFRYYAEHLEEYREMVIVGERLAALADAPEDAPEVGRVADDLMRYFQEHTLPEEFAEQPPWTEGPIGNALSELMMSSFSPAQRRVFELLAERSAEHENRPEGQADQNTLGRGRSGGG